MEKNKVDIYFQLWRKPIFKDGLLTTLSPEEWQTLTALVMFMDENGICYPTLYSIGRVLGIKWVSTVSRRIKQLESTKFQGLPVIRIHRSKKKNENGQLIYANNMYLINPSIFSVFREHESKTIRRQEQMEKYEKDWVKLVDQLSMARNETENNITKTNF